MAKLEPNSANSHFTFFLSLHYRRSLLAQLAGAFHYLGVEVVPNPPMTLLEDISGEDIFQSRTVLVKPTLSTLDRASGPSSRYIWERPAETGHRARMIYFEKNGFQYSTRVFVRKKASGKRKAPLERAGKNLSI